MNGTVPQKAARLLKDLVLHPRNASRYVADNLLQHRSPLDLELPWFSYAAIDFLDGYLTPQMSVCEYGSGGSTLFFARRTRCVVSIEDQPDWYHRVRERLRDQQITNVKLVLEPYNFKDPVSFESSNYLLAMPEHLFDVIVIDGSEEWTQVRPICFRHAQRFIAQGGIIVVDDSWRYPFLRTSHRAREVKTWQSAGPGRPGVTTTDIFFY